MYVSSTNEAVWLPIEKIYLKSKSNMKQGQPVTVQVTQNVPTIILKKKPKLVFFQNSVFLLRGMIKGYEPKSINLGILHSHSKTGKLYTSFLKKRLDKPKKKR